MADITDLLQSALIDVFTNPVREDTSIANEVKGVQFVGGGVFVAGAAPRAMPCSGTHLQRYGPTYCMLAMHSSPEAARVQRSSLVIFALKQASGAGAP